MAIKLNEKGKLKVAMADVRVVMLPTDPPKYRASKEADALEFDTDDFKDVVVLTVEEAKAIAFDLKFLKSFVQFCPSEVKERIAQFESRIERSEAQND